MANEDGNGQGNGGEKAATGEPSPQTIEDMITQLEQDKAKLEQDKKDLHDRLLRTAADFENWKKRTAKEREDTVKFANERILKDLLPVVDNLERAIGAAGGGGNGKSLVEGVELVLKAFMDTLQRLGIERVNAVGLPFDPAVHEAVQHLETAEHPPGTVAMELQAGYRLGDRVIRPAMVVVAKKP